MAHPKTSVSQTLETETTLCWMAMEKIKVADGVEVIRSWLQDGGIMLDYLVGPV